MADNGVPDRHISIRSKEGSLKCAQEGNLALGEIRHLGLRIYACILEDSPEAST